MFSDRPFFAFSFLHPEFYENLDHYAPEEEFSSVVRELTPDDWEMAPRGFWTNCAPAGYEYLGQGWKIHLSAAPWTAEETLRRTLDPIVERGVAFKFVSDMLMLRISLSKNWSRSGAGKFMTVYPRNDQEFLDLLEVLYERTSDLRGPYVLSDRPYRDSRVVFYRYGEHSPRRRVEPSGELTALLEAPDGSEHPDVRSGAFVLPPWVRDIVSEKAPLEPPGEDGVLLNDRYRVQQALRYGATGGIYGAIDTHTGERVVIREGRPMLGTIQDDSDSFKMLRKEARILERLTPTGVLPRFVELFQEWEHLFLVQERIEAESLWGWSINFYFGDAKLTPGESFTMWRDTALRLIAALRTVHENGVVLRDLTRSNTLITAEGQVRFIDLEFAYEAGADDSVLFVQTPGYASPEQLRFAAPTFQADHFSLGVLLLDILTFNASGLDLNREGILASLELALTDLRLPLDNMRLIDGLTDPDLSQRWDLDRAEEFLRSIPVPEDDRPLFQHLGYVPENLRPSRDLTTVLEETVAGLARFVNSKARPARRDALWPSTPEVFTSNPVNVQHGAAGTAFFLLQAEGSVPEESLDWIYNATLHSQCPPGLMRGYAGVAVLLLEAGRIEQALEVLDLGADSEILGRVMGLYFGAAGWGLAQLHFWHRLGEERFLERARIAGERLIDHAVDRPQGVAWTESELVPHGIVNGPSGIALFLLHLAAACGDVRFVELAFKALRFDLAFRREMGEHLLWYPYTNAPPSEPQSPHYWFGTAGIGAALIRAHALTGDAEMRDWAERCAASVAERYTNKIWHDFGLAGFGELQLDLYRFLGDRKYLDTAGYLAEALLPHRVEKPEGYIFCGQEYHRFSCDHGWGATGIGCFLHRVLEPSTNRLLMIDDLLESKRIDYVPDFETEDAVVKIEAAPVLLGSRPG